MKLNIGVIDQYDLIQSIMQTANVQQHSRFSDHDMLPVMAIISGEAQRGSEAVVRKQYFLDSMGKRTKRSRHTTTTSSIYVVNTMQQRRRG